jgi:hypothetical protein
MSKRHRPRFFCAGRFGWWGHHADKNQQRHKNYGRAFCSGTYYLLASDSTWWTSNDNFYYTATWITGRWSRLGDFTPDSDNTWDSQTSFVQAIQDSVATTYVFLADRRCEGCFGDSVYVWLPIVVNGTTLTVDWYDEWTLDAETGEWAAVPCTAGTTHVESIVCSTASGSQGNKYGQVTVTIYDNCNDPFTGAEVTGMFTGSFNETLTETTDGTGVAVITTTTQQKNPSYTFCVDDVNHATLSYDPNDNLETCDSY